MEKSVMNTDMINDNDNIYLSIDNGFEFYKYPIGGDLFLSINTAMNEYYKDRYTYPVSVFIPFIEYNNFGVVADTLRHIDIIDFMKFVGTEYHCMIPDSMKDMVKPTK